MTDGELLLRGVLADPADDHARIVYADWLDDQSDNPPTPRAEFIRVQCELARRAGPKGCRGCKSIRGKHWHRRLSLGQMPPSKGLETVGCSRCVELRRRERELSASSRVHEWFMPIRGTGARDAFAGHFGWGFRRGFVESVTCSAKDWYAHGDAIRAAQPVTRVKLTTGPVESEELTVGSRIGRIWRVAGRQVEFPHAFCPPSTRMLLERRWPGVEFELPPAGFVDDFTPSTGASLGPVSAG